jgi:hypothetical protein
VVDTRRTKRGKVSSIFMLYCCGGRLERVSLKSVPISTIVILIYISDGQIIAQKTIGRQMRDVPMRALFSPHLGAYAIKKDDGWYNDSKICTLKDSVGVKAPDLV